MKEALKLALEALEKIRDADTAGATPKQITEVRKLYEPAITAIKEALAQTSGSVEQEPVGFYDAENKDLRREIPIGEDGDWWQPVYTHPPVPTAQPEQEPRTAEEKLARMKAELAYMRKSQPEQEPVAWITQGGKGWLRWHKSYDDNKDSVPLYTTPPQRTWVGLTKDQMLEILREIDPETQRLPIGFRMFADAIEAKLKEKNT